LAAAQYAEVFATRRALRGALFVLHYRPNALAHARLGLVIPKKQARTAVLRNAIKRQAREIFRSVGSGLPAADLVMRLNAPADRPKQPALAQDRQARARWREEISALFAQLGQKVKG
jgi:ribonuclease P protein component